MERTALCTHAYLSEPTHYERVCRWLQYHALHLPAGWDLVVIDNGSAPDLHESLLRKMHYMRVAPRIVSFSKQYIRNGLAGYEYTWRWIAFLPWFAEFWEYNRVVFAESDFFMCSKAMLEYASSATGLSTVWSKKYNFPESAFFVYTQSGGEVLNRFFNGSTDWRPPIGRIIEEALPWTHVNHDLVGDRYEEKGSTPAGGVDFAAQLRLDESIPTWQGEYR
jgi:hypothetical protein